MSWLAPNSDIECCYLATTGRRTGRTHEIEIWFGVKGDTLYRRGASACRCSPSPSGGSVSAVRSVRSMVSALVCVGVVLGACSEPATESIPITVGSLPEPPAPDTLLPIIVDTAPPDDGTAPPGALFAGDLCASLVAADFAAVNFGGGRGRLVGDPTVLVDGCDYAVEAGGASFTVAVTARSQGDFANPAFGDEQIDELSDLGEAARGVVRPSGYEVYVKVSNGWFSVRAPTEASAVALAARAVPRATREPPATTVPSTTVPATTVPATTTSG